MATYAEPRAVPRVRPQAWSAYLACNVAIGIAYFLLPVLGAADWVGAVLYLAVSVAAPAAIFHGLRRHRPAGRGGWLLLGIGQAVIAGAEFVAYGTEYLWDGFGDPGPSDVLYLAGYPLLAAALLSFVRRRTPEWDLPSVLDAGIMAVSAGVACWIFLVQPLAVDETLTTAAKLVRSGYPVLDLVLLVITVRMILGTGVPTTSFLFVRGSIFLLLAADTAYAAVSLLGVGEFVSPLDGLWMASYALMGAAALHPSMHRIDERSSTATPDAGAGRLAVLTTAVLAAPAIQMVQHLRGADVHVPLIAGSSTVMLLLVMTRLAGMVAAQRTAAVTDGLTGLASRRHFERCLATEVERGARTGQSVALLILDVDRFKQVNDTYGHPGGDRVLIEVARRLRGSIPAGTVVSRYGGEEFAVLLPQTGPEGAAAGAESLRKAIGNTPVTVRPDTLITVTISIGAACLPDHADTAEALVRTADHALYAAKEAGRNRSVVAIMA
jgi:diguanylate cyclase (GGDEF)-like protein